MTKKMPALRYLRHIDLPQLGFAGQEKICAGSVLLVGMGGLGAAAALYLAGAGAGRMGLVDDDRVEESNLQRQVIFDQSNVGELKVLAAQKRLAALNPHVTLEVHTVRLDANNGAALLQPYDVILDCSDNFATRFLLNDLCIALKKPLISASVQGFMGQICSFTAYKGGMHACYRCLFSETPAKGMVPNCPEAGVFGPVVGIMGVYQASAALKFLAGLHPAGEAVFMTVDTLSLATHRLTIPRDPNCQSCGHIH